MELPQQCKRCDYELKSQLHCLWSCPKAAMVWQSTFKKTSNFLKGNFTFIWGTDARSSLDIGILKFEFVESNIFWTVKDGQVRMLPIQELMDRMDNSKAFKAQWRIISSLTLWRMWSARCNKVFEASEEPQRRQ